MRKSASSPQRLLLDKAEARKVIDAWLVREDIADTWDPRTLYDFLEVDGLLAAAGAAGALRLPEGMSLYFDVIASSDGGEVDGYRWLVRVADGLIVAGDYEEMRHIGSPGAMGEAAAHAILEECAQACSSMLAGLAEYAKEARP